MELPQPRFEGDASLEKAIKKRRTVRSFARDPLGLEQLSQLLWAGQGITEDRGFKRAAPSGGALYPMDIYAVVGEGGVQGLQAGVYHYEPQGHAVVRLTGEDLRDALARAALGQMWMAKAPLNLVITAEYVRICGKYGDRGIRYAVMEAGHVGQNIFLQAEAYGLGAGIVGAFRDHEVAEVLKLPRAHEPLLIIPVGYKG
jgi:SagB-type dehydrogenase family enzyme